MIRRIGALAWLPIAFLDLIIRRFSDLIDGRSAYDLPDDLSDPRPGYEARRDR